MTPRIPFYLLAASSPVFAQNFLDPLVVTASRLEQEASRAPYSSEVISSEFIWENTRRTLPEALTYTPGVLVQKTAYGHGSPFIRGFTGRQNLLLVDGVRLNNSTFRSGPMQYWNTVDSLSIDHLELVKSQGSVLYGSDAVGGTVNSFTQILGLPGTAPPDQVFYGGGGSYEYRTNGQGSNIGRIESQTGVGEKFGVWLGPFRKGLRRHRGRRRRRHGRHRLSRAGSGFPLRLGGHAGIHHHAGLQLREPGRHFPLAPHGEQPGLDE